MFWILAAVLIVLNPVWIASGLLRRSGALTMRNDIVRQCVLTGMVLGLVLGVPTWVAWWWLATQL